MAEYKLSKTYPWSATKAVLSYDVQKTITYSDESSKIVKHNFIQTFSFMKNNTKEPKVFERKSIYKDNTFICTITQEGMGDGVISYKVYVDDYPSIVSYDTTAITVNYAVDTIETLADGQEKRISHEIKSQQVQLKEGVNNSISKRTLQESFDISMEGKTTTLKITVVQLGNQQPVSETYVIIITYPLDTTIIPYSTSEVTAQYIIQTIGTYVDGSTGVTSSVNSSQTKIIGDNSNGTERTVSDTISYKGVSKTWQCKQAGGKDGEKITYIIYDVSSPTVKATETSAIITYNVKKIITRVDGSSSTTVEKTGLTCEAKFQPNTLTSPTSVTGTYIDLIYGLVNWTVYQEAAEGGGSGDDYLIEITYTDGSNIVYSKSTTLTQAIVGSTKDKRAQVSSITLKQGVTQIANEACSECFLLTSINFPEGITSIGDNAFYRCSNLGNVVLPNSIKELGQGAFCGCVSFTQFTIPQSLTSIPSDLLRVCKKITHITIPPQVVTIGEGAFGSCVALTSITWNSKIQKIEKNAFQGDEALTYVNIPSSVTDIGEGAFSSCTLLKQITIPDSVITIGQLAFGYCTSLSTFTIPDSVESIGIGLLMGDVSLKTVTLSNNITVIPECAFCNCESLTAITLPQRITEIGKEAFTNTSIKSLTIPKNVTVVKNLAFRGCSQLHDLYFETTNAPTIDYDTTSATDGICRDVKTEGVLHALQSSTVDDYNEWLQAKNGFFFGDYNWSFKNDIEGDDYLIIIEYASGSSNKSNETTLTHSIITNNDTQSEVQVVSVTLKEGVTKIGNLAFEGCSNLDSITIPNSVTCIDNGAFFRCTSLTSVTIPNGVTSIGSQVFMECTNLKSVTIPNNVTSINSEAFYNCKSLTSITLPNGVTSIGNFTFQQCTSLTNVTIPDNITSIGKFAFSYCSSLTSITYQNITYTCLEKLCAALEDKSVTIGESCFNGISHLDDCSDKPEEKQIISTTYSVKEGSVYIQPEVIPASFTSAKLFYTLIPTYHYNDGSQSIGKDINVFAKDITFASNTLYVPTSRTDTYIDTEHDNTRVAWELTIQGQETPVTQPVLKITLNDTYEDVSVITLTVDANESVQGDIEWSLEIVSQDSGTFNPIIKDGVLTFNKHFIGKVKLTAKADNASDYKIISISCNETVTATTYQIVEGSILVSPNQVPANYTQAQLSYTLQPVYEYQLKEPVTGDNIPCKTTIQFLPNTDTKEDNRSGTYVDTEHNNINIPWTLVIQGVEQPITDDSLAYAFILHEGEKRSVSYLTNTLDGDLITAMANKSYYKTFKEEDKNQPEEKAFNMGYVFFLVDKTCSYNIIPYEIQLGENVEWPASSFKRLITNGNKYSYDGIREITIGDKTYRIYGGYIDSDNLTLRYALSDEEVQLDDEEDNPQETDLYDAVVYWEKKGNYTSKYVMYKFYSNANATNLANSIVRIVCNDDLNTTFQREVYGENLGDKLNFYTLNDTNASLSNSDESKLHIKSVICYECDGKTIKKNVKIRIDNTGYWTSDKYGTPTVKDIVINP